MLTCIYRRQVTKAHMIKISSKARIPMRVMAIRNVLPYIIDFKAKFGVAPTYREISKQFKKKSVYTAILYLKILEKEKYIKLSKNAHRQIIVLKQPEV